MENAGEVCNREVVYAHRDTPVADAARLMREHHVGDLVVLDGRKGERTPVGIVTDRDLVIEVIAAGVRPEDLTVGDVMSEELVTAREEEGLPDVIKRMRSKGVRRVPVVDSAGALVGILSVDDVIELFAEQVTDLAKLIAREQSREREQRR
jgi:CBS domain-containing protein